MPRNREPLCSNSFSTLRHALELPETLMNRDDGETGSISCRDQTDRADIFIGKC